MFKQFWLERQDLELPEPTRPKSAPTGRTKGGRTNKPLDAKPLPTGQGTVKRLDGVIYGNTLGPLANNINFPLLLIASKQDVLDFSTTTKVGRFPHAPIALSGSCDCFACPLKSLPALCSRTTRAPRQSFGWLNSLVDTVADPFCQHFPASLNAEEVGSLFELVNGSKRCRILVRPVSAGREILQEAPTLTLQILADAIHAAQVKPAAITSKRARSHQNHAIRTEPENDDTIFTDDCNPLALSTLPSTLMERDVFKSEHKETFFGTRESPSVDLSTLNVTYDTSLSERKEERESTLTTGSPACKRDETTKTAKRAREFDVRKERAAERRTKNDRLKRQQDLARVERAKRELLEIADQKREMVVMQEEEGRSKAAGRYMR